MKRPADEYWCKDRGDFTPYGFGALAGVIRHYLPAEMSGRESREDLISILWDHGIDAYTFEEMWETSSRVCAGKLQEATRAVE